MTCYFCMNPIHGIAVILEDFTKNSYEEKITKHWFSNKDCYDEALHYDLIAGYKVSRN